LQRRAWNVLLAHAYDDLQNKQVHQIDVTDLNKYLDFSYKNIKYLKETLRALVKCLVEWNLLNKDKEVSWGVSALLASVRIEKGKLFYSYSHFLREQLFNPKMYAKISLSIQNKFKSKYSLALYELCLDYFRVQDNTGETPFIPLDIFKKSMCVGESMYAEFDQLNKRLIKEPINEINEISDLDVSVSFRREGRRITGIKFHIKAKKKSLLFPLPSNQGKDRDKPITSEDENLNILVGLTRIKTDTLRSIIASALAEKDLEYVRSNILYANEHAQKNYTFYFKESLKNDWAKEKREESVFEAQESQRRETGEMVRYVENLAKEHLSRGLPERFLKLETEKREKFLERAKIKILGSNHKDFLLRAENRELLEIAIREMAIKEMAV
jgi:plasmid replication initiation protein